jgi:hypothetical protein
MKISIDHSLKVLLPTAENLQAQTMWTLEDEQAPRRDLIEKIISKSGVLGLKIGGEPRNCHTQHLFFSDLPLVHARKILI